MEPSRAVNALVAVHVDGWKRIDAPLPHWPKRRALVNLIDGTATTTQPYAGEWFIPPGMDPAKSPPFGVELPDYATDDETAMEMEARVAELANYMGEIVKHRDGHGYRGVCLKEKYVMALLRLTSGVSPFKTTMGENNWIDHKFRSNELWNLLHATPLQRCMAALLAVGVELPNEEPPNGPA